MADKKRGLGRGLKNLFGDEAVENTSAIKEKQTAAQTKEVRSTAKKKTTDTVNEKAPDENIVKLSRVWPNKNQPRKQFDEEKLAELTDSIKQYGVLQPLIVKKKDNGYEIIAGERRWRAAQAAGIKEIPVVVRDYSEQQAMEISIIENIQRADLNPIEEALGYKMLIDDYELKQDEVAKRVSKNRSTITNMLRLLKLCPEVQSMMISGELSQGHARALLAVEDAALQKKIADDIIKRALSVREVERFVKSLMRKRPEKTEEPERDYSLFFREYEDSMKSILGTKVHIHRKDKNKGRIEIDYYSSAELERIMELFKSIR